MGLLQRGWEFFKNPKAYVDDKIKAALDREFLRLGLQSIEQISAEDIIIVGYPKSGNTWFQNLTTSLLLEMNPGNLPDALAQDIVPDVHARLYYKRYFPQMFFKSHHFPQPAYKKVVYLVRDGRDALVSYYAMNKNRGIDANLEEMITKGKHTFPGKWGDHARQWLQNPYEAEMIVIKYEDLLIAPLESLKKFCDFAGLDRSEATLQQAIQGNAFDRMKVKEKQLGPYNQLMNAKGNFLRKGKTGSYLEEMPPDLQRYFEQEAGDMLQHFGYQ
ncbi:MAG: sulfotransferase domain-containing protein [Phaeodactylibacter sp.]|nr:sulfotransferase domain-containing protein [Phaeodactylibacter sp.]